MKTWPLKTSLHVRQGSLRAHHNLHEQLENEIQRLAIAWCRTPMPARTAAPAARSW